MGLFDKLLTRDATEPVEESGAGELTPTIDDPLLSALLHPGTVGKDEAMGIPAFAACVDVISSTVAALPVRLYRRVGDRVEEVRDDRRVQLLNAETGDTLNATELKAALVRDYYTDKGGFAYVNRVGNDVVSIHYVDPAHISFQANTDPIFKRYSILVDGKAYEPWRFIRILRNTKDGRKGVSLIEQSNQLLNVAYSTLRFEQSQVQRGGSKRGFLKSGRKLSEPILAALRKAFRRLYSSTEENFVVLNEGVEFQEASETSLEMQLAETKEANGKDIYSLFKMPPAIIQGGATENDRDNFVRYCIMGLLAEIKPAFDAALLLESEKGTYYFDFDLTEFSKANMKDRWEAWANAKDKGLVQVDEFRYEENLPPLGMDYVNMGLNDVLYEPNKKQLIIPNMGTVIDLETMDVLSNSNPSLAPKGGDNTHVPEESGGGEEDEGRNSQ